MFLWFYQNNYQICSSSFSIGSYKKSLIWRRATPGMGAATKYMEGFLEGVGPLKKIWIYLHLLRELLDYPPTNLIQLLGSLQKFYSGDLWVFCLLGSDIFSFFFFPFIFSSSFSPVLFVASFKWDHFCNILLIRLATIVKWIQKKVSLVRLFCFLFYHFFFLSYII